MLKRLNSDRQRITEPSILQSTPGKAAGIVVFANFATAKYIDHAGDTRSVLLVQKCDDPNSSWYVLDHVPQELLYRLPHMVDATTNIDGVIWVDVNSWTVYGTNEGNVAKRELFSDIGRDTMNTTLEQFLEVLVEDGLVEKDALIITMGAEAAECTKDIELATLSGDDDDAVDSPLAAMQLLRMPHIYYVGGVFAKAARDKHWMPGMMEQCDNVILAMLQKCGSAISECTLFRDQLAAWKRDPTLANLFTYKLSQEECAKGGRTDASEEYKALHGWKKGETKWSRAASSEKKRPPKDLHRIVKKTGLPATDRLQEKTSIGGTNSAIAERKRPAKDKHRIVKKTQKPATDRLQEKTSLGGTKTGELQLRRGNTGSDEKFERNLITNSLGLSADEVADWKKVHGDLRKFMADTKSTKDAASDLGIRRKILVGEFLCGTLPTKKMARRMISAVAEALKGR
jgi:hypothetical protein